MVLVCLPSDALSQHLQHLLSYLGFSYLGHGVSLHGCSSKAQPLLLTLDEGYLLTAASPDHLGIIYYLHCAWRPQSSGKVERDNQFLKSAIKKMTQETSLG